MIKYILNNKWLVLPYLTMSLISSGMTVYLSLILRDIIDVAIDLEMDRFYSLLMTSAIFFILFGIVNYITDILYTWLINKTIRNVREDVFTGIMKQDVGQFKTVNSADYISALTNDVDLLEDNYFSAIAGAVELVMLIIIATGFMIYLSFIVTISLLATSIILIGAQSLFGVPLKKRQKQLSESLSAFTVKIKDIFSGFEVIRSYQMYDYAKKRFRESNDEVIRSSFSLLHLSTISGAIATVVGLFLQVGVVFFSAYLIIQGRLTPGDMIGLLIISSQITNSVEALGQAIPAITGSKEVRQRVLGLLMRDSGYKGTQVATFNSEITVEKLKFTYPEQETSVLKGVDFIFEKGRKYTLVGKSGSGKTTLAKVLAGHLCDYYGNILYDQVELKELSDESFGKLPAMVHQNVYMFDEDIEQNICLHKEYSEENLHAAIYDSGVSLFLNENRSLQTMVGENGANLSGGQRQRIAVARALIQNKPLLILDEGTSAVDKQTATDIEKRLLERVDLTLLTITHNLDEEMLRQYDKIIYMEDGGIVESGSFDHLISLNDKFSQYMYPKSVFTEEDHHLPSMTNLPIIQNQPSTLNSAFDNSIIELNQSMEKLRGKLSQQTFPDSAFDTLQQNMKELNSKFSRYLFQNSVLEQMNQNIRELNAKIDQPTSFEDHEQSSEEEVLMAKSIYFS